MVKRSDYFPEGLFRGKNRKKTKPVQLKKCSACNGDGGGIEGPDCKVCGGSGFVPLKKK